MPEGIPLLLGDNGAQGVSFIYPGAHAPCLSPYHYAVVMAFDEVLLVPRAEAVHHVFVSQFQHPEVFGSLHPVVYIQFKEFAFHIQHRHGICLTGTFQYPEFFIQVFFLLRIDIKLLIHHARTHGLGELFTKCVRSDATVVYNDFDNYRCRLVNIPATNVLLSDLRRIAEGEPRNKRITGEIRDKMFARIEREEKEHGYVDYITVSASLLFAMKYVTSLEGMKKEAIYNRIRQTDYPEAKDYLEGLTITSEDYKEVFKRYKDVPGVVFLVDPPYLSTEVGTYKMFWRLADYLDVLTVLKGHSFVYFTSNKSSILELCDWMDRNPFVGSPFKECRKVEFSASVNYQAKYTDMMLYTKPDEVSGIAA